MTTVDTLILDLINSGRQATPDEVTAIIAHVAQAPFATYLSRVPVKIRTGLAKIGKPISVFKMRNVEWHLLQRIYLDEQWPRGTTEEGYVADLQKAVLHPHVKVWTYSYSGYPALGFLAPSHVQNAPRPESYIFVVYSPIFATLTTGFQASGIESVFSKEMTHVIQHR